MKLLDDELENITGGGAIRNAILTTLAGLIVLLVGVLDGYTNPTKCNTAK